MLVKLYFSVWVLAAISAIVVFAATGFTSMSVTVFGFVGFSLTFIGMIAVLPIWASHHEEVPRPEPVKAEVPQAAPAAVEAFSVLKSA